MKKRAPAPSAARRPAAIPAGIDPRWRWHYRTLAALRDRLLDDRDVQRAEATEPEESRNRQNADVATDESTHDVAFSLLAAEENALAEVNAAIERIAKGRYGRCEATGKPIPAERLKAIPWCRYTVEAAKGREGGEAGRSIDAS